MYSQVPREPGSRVFLTSRVPALDFSRGLPDIPDTGGQVARGTYLGTRAAKAVHQALWLQVGVPALARGVFLPVEKAEHVWAWQTNQCFVSSRRLQPETLPHPSFFRFQEECPLDHSGKRASIGHALPVRGPEHLSLNLSLTAHLLCDFRHATAPL